jgi:hypothetical protein
VRLCIHTPLPRLPEAIITAAVRVRGAAGGLQRFSLVKLFRRGVHQPAWTIRTLAYAG